MKVRKSITGILGLGVAAMLAVGIAQAQDHPEHPSKSTKAPKDKAAAVAKIGEAAPAFTLKNLEGDEQSLKDFEGKIVVIEWINPQCPWVMRAYDNKLTATTIEELKKLDENIVYLGVNSTAQGTTEDEVTKETAAFLREHKVEIPVLVDFAGTMGKAYGAKTTPHMFVIDDKGVLRYEGAFTNDDKTRFDAAKRENYVVNAVKQIKAGETVSPDSVKSWGCGVKFASK